MVHSILVAALAGVDIYYGYTDVMLLAQAFGGTITPPVPLATTYGAVSWWVMGALLALYITPHAWVLWECRKIKKQLATNENTPQEWSPRHIDNVLAAVRLRVVTRSELRYLFAASRRSRIDHMARLARLVTKAEIRNHQRREATRDLIRGLPWFLTHQVLTLRFLRNL